MNKLIGKWKKKTSYVSNETHVQEISLEISYTIETLLGTDLFQQY